MYSNIFRKEREEIINYLPSAHTSDLSSAIVNRPMNQYKLSRTHHQSGAEDGFQQCSQFNFRSLVLPFFRLLLRSQRRAAAISAASLVFLLLSARVARVALFPRACSEKKKIIKQSEARQTTLSHSRAAVESTPKKEREKSHLRVPRWEQNNKAIVKVQLQSSRVLFSHKNNKESRIRPKCCVCEKVTSDKCE
jgi:hypothetical protein